MGVHMTRIAHVHRQHCIMILDSNAHCYFLPSYKLSRFGEACGDSTSISSELDRAECFNFKMYVGVPESHEHPSGHRRSAHIAHPLSTASLAQKCLTCMRSSQLLTRPAVCHIGLTPRLCRAPSLAIDRLRVLGRAIGAAPSYFNRSKRSYSYV